MSQFPGQGQYGNWIESTPQYNRMPPRMPNMGGKGGQQPQGPWMPSPPPVFGGGGKGGRAEPPWMPSPFPPRQSPWMPSPFPQRDPWRQNQNIPQPGGYYPQPPSSPTYPGSVYPMPGPDDPWRIQPVPDIAAFPFGGGSYTQPNTPFGYGRTPDMSYRFGGRGRPSNMYGFNNPHYQAYEGYQPI